MYNGTAGLEPRGSGAYHGSDVEMVFGTGRDVSLFADSAAEDSVSAYMMGARAAFARDPKKGLLEYDWPLYNPDGETLVELALDDSRTASFAVSGLYDAACPEVNVPLPGQGAF